METFGFGQIHDLELLATQIQIQASREAQEGTLHSQIWLKYYMDWVAILPTHYGPYTVYLMYRTEQGRLPITFTVVWVYFYLK